MSDLKISEAGSVQFPMVAHVVGIGWNPITPSRPNRNAAAKPACYSGMSWKHRCQDSILGCRRM